MTDLSHIQEAAHCPGRTSSWAASEAPHKRCCLCCREVAGDGLPLTRTALEPECLGQQGLCQLHLCGLTQSLNLPAPQVPYL